MLTRREILKGAGAVGSAAYIQSSAPTDLFTGPLSPPAEAARLHSKAYRDGRIDKIRRAVRAANLDAIIISNRCLDYIGYASNFHPFPLEPGVALIPADGPTVLFVITYSSAHTRALEPLVWVDDLVDVPHDSISEGSNQNLFDACVQRLREQKLASGRLGLCGDEIDWILPYYLREKLPDGRIHNANRTLTEVIVVKDDVEQALIRFAQRYIDEIAYPTFMATLRPGAVDQAVYARVLSNMIERGASPWTVLLFDAGSAGSGTWASGVHGRKLEASDIVLSEPTPSIFGYQAEKMYTFALSRNIPESQKRGADVVYDAYNMVLSELKPGRDLTPILDKVDTFMRRHGYDGDTVPVGHWIGTQNHEGPRFTREGTRGWVLSANMVMSWHPNIVVPGKVRTTCSSCVVITPDGAKDLSSVKMQPLYYI